MAGEDTEFDRLMSHSVNPSNDDAEPNVVVLDHMSKLGLDKDQVHVVRVCGSFSMPVCCGKFPELWKVWICKTNWVSFWKYGR